MIVHIFEDHKESVLAQLYRAAYPISVSASFEYADGVSNLESKIKEFLSKSYVEAIVAYMDAIPGNKSTRDIYFKLRHLARGSNIPVHIVPLVCAEFYFIKAFSDCSSLILLPDAVKSCAELSAIYSSDIVSTDEDKRYCNSFERYCKLVQAKAFRPCASASSSTNIFFYQNDCVADVQMSLHKKGLKYVQVFPCFPRGGGFGHLADMTKVISYCVKVHNDLCDAYIRLTGNCKKYKYIPV